MKLRIVLVTAVGLGITGSLTAGDVLAPPVRLVADGEPIDTEIGHAAPYVTDFDGDGIQDLLVGQFGSGLLRIYRNEGTHTEPQLAAAVTFRAGNEDGRVPSG